MNSIISSRRNLEQLPDDLPWQEFDCGIVESAGSIQFLQLPERAAEARSFPRGHVFGCGAELRWALRANGTYHLVYISDEGRTLAGSSDVADLVGTDYGQIIVWGERDGETNGFFDGRIPDVIRYPTSAAGKRLAVRTRLYVLNEPWKDREDEQHDRLVQLFRCIGLATAAG